jgi:hypothetical protein
MVEELNVKVERVEIINELGVSDGNNHSVWALVSNAFVELLLCHPLLKA